MYKKMIPLQKEIHSGLKYQKPSTLAYAAQTNVSPIHIDEFFSACKSQPILFASDASGSFPVVLLGMKPEENLYLDKKQLWLVGEYCPAYIRDYPFASVRVSNKKQSLQIALAFDEEAKSLSTKKGIPLIEADGTLTQPAEKLLEYQQNVVKMNNITATFVAELQKLKLLVPFEPKIRSGDEVYALKGFLAVNEKGFKGLSIESKTELMKKGFYDPIVAHLISLSNLSKVALLKSKTKAR
jgi:hypothetical protein